MKNSQPWYSLGLTITIAVLALLSACRWVNTVDGRQISVVFRNAEDVQSGSAVYVSGVEVGTTSAAVVSNGRANVPVQLYRQQKNAVAAGTVFLVGRDPKRPLVNCLTGYAAAISPDASKAADVFYGASNRLELIGLIGLEKVTRLVDSIMK